MNHTIVLLALTLSATVTLGACMAPGDDDLDTPEAEEEAGTDAAAVTAGSVGSIMQVVNGGLCMTVSQQAGNIWRVVQQPCISDVSMRFYARPIAGAAGYFSIEAMGRCLDVPSSSAVSGVDLQLYPCHKQTNQQFQLVQTGNGYEIHPRSAPSLCLDIETGTTAPGNILQQYTCHGGTNQRFLIRPTMSEEFFGCDAPDLLHLGWPVPSANNPTYLDMANGQSFYFGANLVRWRCGPFSGNPWYDAEKACASGTTTIEIARILANRDTFRLRCIQ